MSVATTKLQIPGVWPSLRPVVQVGGFAFAFVVTSLLCILPVALLTGKTRVGIWYILPFTVLFLIVYQRIVHKERLSNLGLDFKKAWAKNTSAGFAGAGVVVGGIAAAHVSAGWVAIPSSSAAGIEAHYVAAGIGLALLLNLGIGVGEELLFRGYILRRLLIGYRSAVPGVVISAGAFSAAHFQSEPELLGFIDLFLLGIVLALAVILTRSLWLSIGIHMGWDFWSEGVYFFRLPKLDVSRLFFFKYNIHGEIELLAFKLVVAAFLIAASAWLIHRIRAQRRAEEGLR